MLQLTEAWRGRQSYKKAVALGTTSSLLSSFNPYLKSTWKTFFSIVYGPSHCLKHTQSPGQKSFVKL